MAEGQHGAVNPVVTAGTGATLAPSASSPSSPTVLEGRDYAPQPRRPWLFRMPVARGLLLYLAVALLLGALAGLVWHALVDLPAYQVSGNGSASISERGLAHFFDTDGWFCVLGAVLGLVTGLVAWFGFRRLGWPVVVVAAVTAELAGLACWLVGVALGPRDFVDRIAAATGGQRVPIDFALHAHSALLVWPLFATIPVMLASSLGRDEDEPRRQRRLPWRRRDAAAPDRVVTETPVPPPAG